MKTFKRSTIKANLEEVCLRNPLGSEATSTLLDSNATKAEIIETVHDKVIISGKYTEHYNYQYGIRIGNKRKRRRKSRKRDKNKVTSDASRRRSSIDSANKIRRLLNTNFSNESKFVTLTFRDTDDFNIRDIKQCNYKFKKFIQRLKYKYNKVKYLVVIEFQKRGAIHYHLIVDSSYIKHKDLERVWGLGFVFIEKFNDVRHIGAYMAKYMTKSRFDKRLKGEKCYFRSKNLSNPQIVYGEDAIKLLQEQNLHLNFSNNYESFINGKVTYNDYQNKNLSLNSLKDDS